MELAIFGAVVLVILIGFVVKKNKEDKVPQGLQIWDANGSPVLDTTDRIARVLGQVSFSGGGSRVDNRLTSGQPFFFAQFHNPPTSWDEAYPVVTVTFSGNRMTWTVNQYDASSSSGVIFYGVR